MIGRRAFCHALAASALACACSAPDQSAPSSSARPAAPTELAVIRVGDALGDPDPGASYWANAPVATVTLMAQPMVTPRPESTATERVEVQAVHDGTKAAFRMRWADAEKSEAGHLGEYSDAAALEFPMGDGPPPSVMMGEAGKPVHLFHWRAQYQRDLEKGKPEMKDLYPNYSVDMYPMDFKEAKSGTQDEKEKFSPGVAIGNPQSFVKRGVDEIVAEGFSTSAVQEGHGSAARGVHEGGYWTLVVVRPLAIEGGSNLRVGERGNVAFAIWQGGKGEVGSRKSVALQWFPVVVQ